MAAKIKDGLKELRDSAMNAIRGPKYQSNLLGEPLYDLLRQATSKALLVPDEELNQKVVDAILQEAAGGKDSKDAVSGLKRRLRTDHPQKQLLSVILTGKVMQDCHQAVSHHQEELLQEVARVMSRPARPESDAGKQARAAAKELLRRYGRAGTDAFRAANRAAVPGRPGVDAAHYNGATLNSDGGVVTEEASVIAEAQMLIEQAHANTELLSELLMNSVAGGQPQQGPVDDFEANLSRDLLVEVRDLRSLLTVYLEQLQGLQSPQAEATLMRALEAADLLDNTLSLEQEVLLNQAAGDAALAGVAAGDPSAIAAQAGLPAARPPPPPQQPAVHDLISLDDPVDLVPSGPTPAAYQAPTTGPHQTAPSPAAAADPFAAGFAGLSVTPQPPFSSPGAPAPPPYGGGYPGTSMQVSGMPSVSLSLTDEPAAPVGHYAAPQPSSLAFTYPAATAPAAAAPAPVAAAPLPAHVFSSINPFAGQPTSNPFGGAMGAPAMAAPRPAAAGVPPDGTASVDQEWDMFFANRAGQPQASRS